MPPRWPVIARRNTRKISSGGSRIRSPTSSSSKATTARSPDFLFSSSWPGTRPGMRRRENLGPLVAGTARARYRAGRGITMADMRLIVAGAGGRMGRSLTRVISETPGAVLAGALEAPGSELLGKDAGVLAGLPANGIKLSADLWALSKEADGILDFTVPGATIANVAIAAERGHRPRDRHDGPVAVGRCRDQERHLARRRGEVGQYEPRRQSAGGAGEARGAVARSRPSISKSWRCTTGPRSTRRRARR